MRRFIMVVLLLAVSALAFTQEKPFTAKIDVSAIEVIAEVTDANGRTPADLKPEDFILYEDGVEQPVVAVEPLAPAASAVPPASASPATPAAPAVATRGPWDSLIYIDYELSSRTTVRDAVRALIAQAPVMTKYGPVEVVVADPAPRRLLAPTTDAQALAAALTTASKLAAQSRLAIVRKQFLASNEDSHATGEEQYTRTSDLRSSIAEEGMLVRNFIGRLSTWLGSYPRRGTRALFLVADGFDINPADFYAETLYPTISDGNPESVQRTLSGNANRQDLKRNDNMAHARREASKLDSENMMDRNRAYYPLAREAAAAGWTIISMRGGLNAELAGEATMRSGDNNVANFLAGDGGAGNPSRGMQMRPAEALVTFAEATGGALVADTTKFGRTIESLGNRVRLTYQVSRPVDGVLREISIKPRRAGLSVKSAQYAAAATPELAATARAAAILAGADQRGELPVAMKLSLDPATRKTAPYGTLEARVGLSSLAALRSQLQASNVRVTVGVAAGNEQPRIIHQLHSKFDLSQLDEAAFDSAMQLPKNADKVAIVVEDLTTGAWGAAMVPVPKNANIATTAGWNDGPAIAWLDPAVAQQLAKRERKLILQCNSCDENLFTNANVRNLLGPFAVTRTTGTGSVAVLDQWGRPRFEWTPANAIALAARLQETLTVAPGIVRAGEQLAGGESADAHFALGFAYLKTQSYEAAQKEYEIAANVARAAGDEALAQRAEVQGAAAMAQNGGGDAAVATLQRIAKYPASRANAAEAWLVIGHLLKDAGNDHAAKAAFSHAAENAPEGSELQKLAANLAGS
ncbi:MAG TPA: hypothetical protein VFN10_01915 [Thermoanaerobaculia bacterium]|nr:hypothetical protein [Thermoanaerobaculia bacterium]